MWKIFVGSMVFSCEIIYIYILNLPLVGKGIIGDRKSKPLQQVTYKNINIIYKQQVDGQKQNVIENAQLIYFTALRLVSK